VYLVVAVLLDSRLQLDDAIVEFSYLHLQLGLLVDLLGHILVHNCGHFIRLLLVGQLVDALSLLPAHQCNYLLFQTLYLVFHRV
jgi:hypothetical protein